MQHMQQLAKLTERKRILLMTHNTIFTSGKEIIIELNHGLAKRCRRYGSSIVNIAKFEYRCSNTKIISNIRDFLTFQKTLLHIGYVVLS